jgi:hypothetical protein
MPQLTPRNAHIILCAPVAASLLLIACVAHGQTHLSIHCRIISPRRFTSAKSLQWLRN